jgi:hypothetical protein
MPQGGSKLPDLAIGPGAAMRRRTGIASSGKAEAGFPSGQTRSVCPEITPRQRDEIVIQLHRITIETARRAATRPRTAGGLRGRDDFLGFAADCRAMTIATAPTMGTTAKP